MPIPPRSLVLRTQANWIRPVFVLVNVIWTLMALVFRNCSRMRVRRGHFAAQFATLRDQMFVPQVLHHRFWHTTPRILNWAAAGIANDVPNRRSSWLKLSGRKWPKESKPSADDPRGPRRLSTNTDVRLLIFRHPIDMFHAHWLKTPPPPPIPSPAPDPEPQPGSDPDVVPPINPEPPEGFPPAPEPEPMPI